MPPIADLAREFILVRRTRMREVNLEVFDFDYDLTWAGFFLNAEETVHGRYGSRDASSADSQVSLAGLRHAMQAALERHRRDPQARPETPIAPRTVEQLRSIRRLPARGCVHCHQVRELLREERQDDGTWQLDDEWVYPQPGNIGLTLDVDRGDLVRAVAAKSAAAHAGLRPGDQLESVHNFSIASIADLQYALHRAPARGEITMIWTRDGREQRGTLSLEEGWRKTDLSWRWSLRALGPNPCVRGDDLAPQEKKALGLAPTRLAFRQYGFVHPAARQAGVRPGDIVLGIDRQMLEMTARQFQAHVRLTYKVGDLLLLDVLRDGKPLQISLKLPGRSLP